MESHFEECPPRTNILVVDNCITTLLNMKRTITQFNFQVMIETNGDRALAFLRNSRHEINIVIWDLHMPGINGIEALKVIGSEMDLPVIIMSDDNQYDSVMEAIYHGACDYVLKPVPKEKIAFIWQHIVRKKMKSKPVSTPVAVQSDLAQSGGLDHVKDDSTRSGSDQKHNTEIRNKEKSAESTAWTEVKIRPFRRDLIQRNDVDQQNEDNGELNTDKAEENAAKKPRTEETQVVQTDRLQTDSLDQDNVESRVWSEDNIGEGNIENKKKKRAQRPRVFWTGDLHKRFLEAIEIVGGIEKANPKVLLRCLEDMKIEGLTRYNVASHLQKYRISLDEAQIAQCQTQEFGSSSSLLAPNNVHTASSSHLLNGQAMNPMQQNQYPSGSLTMNNNQFITDPDCYLTNIPYLDCLRDPRNLQYLLSNPHLLAQRRQLSNYELQYQPSYQQLPYQISNQQLQYQFANVEQPYQSSYQQQQYQLGTQEQQFRSADQEHQCLSFDQPQQSESATQHHQSESANQQPYQSYNQQLQFQSTTQELQYQSTDQELQYQSADQDLQYLSADQDLQYQSADQELQHSANQQQHLQSANEQEEYQPADQQQHLLSASEQASDDFSAADVELIYPSLPYDPTEYFLNGHNFNQ